MKDLCTQFRKLERVHLSQSVGFILLNDILKKRRDPRAPLNAYAIGEMMFLEEKTLGTK